MAAVPPPPTPVMLYLGAGYDLSPLLSFSPNPPYQITPARTSIQRPTYTSFLFADAKPRHTSAFMVPDFGEWIDVPARVRNVVRYAQGMLNRWRLVNDDLIWFEGGGSPVHRRADPNWHFVPHPTSALPQPHVHDPPLVTLIYVFNTLDIELAHMSILAHVWPCVSALYVHGLRPHSVTGLDLLIGKQPKQLTEDVVATGSNARSHIRGGLQHVYVLVGSWGTPRHARARGAGAQRGVRHVDFVRAGWRQWQGRDGAGKLHTEAPLTAIDPRATICFPVPESDSDIDTDAEMHSPLVFRRERPASWDSKADQWSGCESDNEESAATTRATPTPDLATASTLGSQLHMSSRRFSSPRFSTVSICSAGARPRGASFYTRIPQIAWDDGLNGGRGGYYVSKTVEESLAVWRARGDSLLETEGEDSGEEGDVGKVEVNITGGTPAQGANVRRAYPLPPCVDTDHSRRTRTASPRPRLRPRRAEASRPTSAPARQRRNSASDTDVSDETRPRPSFWRRGTTSLSDALFPPPREHRINLSDFLRTSASPSPTPPPCLPYTLHTHSCPDLKDPADSRVRDRSFPTLRAFATLRRRGGSRPEEHDAAPPRTPRRVRLGSSTAPPTSAPASPPSRRERSSPRYKRPRSSPREEPDWLGRLIGGRNRLAMDSYESDVTRVDD